jgi:UDP-N-acetylmuramyl tripeptide synthase
MSRWRATHCAGAGAHDESRRGGSGPGRQRARRRRALQRRVHDTRTLRRGELFVALRGERFDGHGFLQNAAAAKRRRGDRFEARRRAAATGRVVDDTRSRSACSRGTGAHGFGPR